RLCGGSRDCGLWWRRRRFKSFGNQYGRELWNQYKRWRDYFDHNGDHGCDYIYNEHDDCYNGIDNFWDNNRGNDDRLNYLGHNHRGDNYRINDVGNDNCRDYGINHGYDDSIHHNGDDNFRNHGINHGNYDDRHHFRDDNRIYDRDYRNDWDNRFYNRWHHWFDHGRNDGIHDWRNNRFDDGRYNRHGHQHPSNSLSNWKCELR